MIKKVLIAEDHEIVNISLQRALEKLGIADPSYVYYCDDAMVKIQRAIQDDHSYDLLITDLSFAEDEKKQQIADGMELIAAARIIQPDLKVLVFSAAGDATTIGKLFNELDIDGYVRKGRNDTKELELAIATIAQNRQYCPRPIADLLKEENTYPFSQFEKAIISLLTEGVLQKDIPAHLKQRGIEPSSQSSVEKRLKQMKDALDFSKNEQLVLYCKNRGII